MLKRYFIITLLLLAYTIVLGHSIIPHHHHNEEHETLQTFDQHEHNNDHHDNDEDDDGSLFHEFKKYLHTSGTDDIYQKSTLKIDYSTITTLYLITAFNFHITILEDTSPLVNLSNNFILPSEYFLSSKGLRAPPLV